MTRSARPSLRAGVIAFVAIALALSIADLVRPSPAWAIVFVALGVASIVLFRITRARGPSAAAVAAGAPPAGSAPPGPADLLRQGLRMGTTAFGGAMAVVAQIDRELVGRLRWVGPDAFAEAAAIGQSLPGAMANNALALLGFRLGGWTGAALLAGGYVLPSFLLMLVFGLAYERLRGVVEVDAALAGLSPAVVAVVAQVALSLWRRMLTRTSGESWPRATWRVRGPLLVALAATVTVAWMGLGAPEVILCCGLAALAWSVAAPRLAAVVPLALPALPAALHATRLGALGEVLGVFLRTGATTFGGGYVMVPVLEHELVRGGWIGTREFMDAVALGQVTPGPVVITATFVGYRLVGLAGALFGTLAVFAPSFLMSMAVAGSIERVRRHPAASAFVAGLQPAITGVMTAAVVSLARSGIHGWTGIALALVGFAVLANRRVGVGVVLIGSAALGVALRLMKLPL